MKKLLLCTLLIGIMQVSWGGSWQCNAQTKVKQPVPSAEARLKFYQQHQELKSSPALENRKWRHIGPERMSGRITDIAVPLDQPYTIYVASASGGLWKTTNEGTTWSPIFDDAPSAAWGAITVDPSDSNIVWAGGGESNIFRSSMAGTGVYKSVDAGKTWTHLGLAETHHIGRILVHPKDSNTVYVAASGKEWTRNEQRGVYKTTDGGKTWAKVFFIDKEIAAVDLAMSPKYPNVLLASMWNRTREKWSDPVPGPRDGVFKTTDGGKTWKQVSQGLPPAKTAGRIGLSFCQSNPETVYAIVDNPEVARKAKKGERDSYGRLRKDVIKGAEVYRSDDAGDTWRLTSKPSRLMSRLFATYGWVFGQIRVDPNNVDHVYIMGVPLLKSVDGGVTFKSIGGWGVHGDHHSMWIDPNNSNHVINGNDGGLNISYDAGKTWKDIKNIPVVQFYNVEVDNAKPFNVYGSLQDHGSYMGPSNYRPGFSPMHLWKGCPGGEASIIAVDPNDQNTVYSTGFYGSLERTDMAKRNTKNLMPKRKKGDKPLRGQWLAPFILSPHNSQVIYHGMNRVMRSMDRGESWKFISPDLTYNDPSKQGNIPYATITSLSESPFEFGVLYVGTDDGKVVRTMDGGTSWHEIMKGIPRTKWVSRIVASKYKKGTVFLGQNGKRDNDFQVYVYRSDDHGVTWKDISVGIPGGPVNVVVEDPFYEDVLYVGTDLGVYVSTNGGKNWKVLAKGLPNPFVHDMKIQQRDKVAVIGTHGRGVFKLDMKQFYAELKKERNPEKEDSKD